MTIDIKKAADRIKPYVHRTLVLSNTAINQMLGAEIFFKCENFQKVGAFKARGACNAVLSLETEQLQSGVATHSSGNHGAALAYAARMKEVPAYVVMPSNAPQVKKDAVAGYGAEIIYCEPNEQARVSTLEEIVQRTGATFIHPYDNDRIIEGQATAAWELIEDYPGLDIIMTPVGGGGLASGAALAVSQFSSSTKMICAEPLAADDAYRSIAGGSLVPSVSPETIADGLLTSLSERTFGILKEHVSEIVTVSEESIVAAMRHVWERMKIIIEPSSAVPLAALFEAQVDVASKRVGVIFSGGNVDLARLPWQ